MTEREITDRHRATLETALTDLNCATICLSQIVADEGGAKVNAVLALVRQSAATIEHTLRAANVLETPVTAGDFAAWFGVRERA